MLRAGLLVLALLLVLLALATLLPAVGSIGGFNIIIALLELVAGVLIAFSQFRTA